MIAQWIPVVGYWELERTQLKVIKTQDHMSLQRLHFNSGRFKSFLLKSLSFQEQHISPSPHQALFLSSSDLRITSFFLNQKAILVPNYESLGKVPWRLSDLVPHSFTKMGFIRFHGAMVCIHLRCLPCSWEFLCEIWKGSNVRFSQGPLCSHCVCGQPRWKAQRPALVWILGR